MIKLPQHMHIHIMANDKLHIYRNQNYVCELENYKKFDW